MFSKNTNNILASSNPRSGSISKSSSVSTKKPSSASSSKPTSNFAAKSAEPIHGINTASQTNYRSSKPNQSSVSRQKSPNQSRLSSAHSAKSTRIAQSRSTTNLQSISMSRAGTSMSNTSSKSSSTKALALRRSSSSIVQKEKDLPGILTKQKILQKHLFKKDEEMNELEFIQKLKRARLDRLHLLEIDDGLKLFQSTTHIYLQHNYISQIIPESFDHLASSLVFLTLAYNKLTNIKGFQNLRALQLLDLEGNLIVEDAFESNEVVKDSLPASLQYLILRENPISENPEYRLIVIAAAPFLAELDEKRVTNLERRVAVRSTNANVDLDQFDEEDEEGEEESVEEESTCPDNDDALEKRFLAILQRSKERQSQFEGKAAEYEKIISKVCLERKDHWHKIQQGTLS